MGVLVFADSYKGKIAKSALEAVYYGAKIASEKGVKTTVVNAGSVSQDDLAALGKYGADAVLQFTTEHKLEDRQLTKLVAEAAQKVGAEFIIFALDPTGKGVAPRVSARLKAGYVAGAVELPKTEGGNLVVKKNVFSGKAFGYFAFKTEQKVIAVLPNSLPPQVEEGKTANVEAFAPDLGDSGIKIKEIKKQEGELSLTEAEIVVSAGRGLKGPENWGLVEELAKELGAATACSRPVSDIGWRPHHEHVGQTGIAIRPNLYIAAGISGAIQHLAGVNGSKTIVVINTDPEAPFFKAADYGIVGDAFEVLPKLTEAVKAFNATK
ncbi:MAG: electron transfer flavoprotein subunit alpha/FixB family protein [Luteibaculaceae bacterium]